MGHLTPLRIGDTEHRGLADGRMLGCNFFDIFRVDVDSA